MRANVARILALMERLAPPEPAAPASLLAAITEATAGGIFTVAEVWAVARKEAQAAAAIGAPEPKLSAALRETRIRSPKSLGHWLGGHGEVERGGLQRGSRQWQVRGKGGRLPSLPP